MKMTLFITLLLALGAGILFTTNRTTAQNKNLLQVPSQSQSVKITSFEVVDAQSVMGNNAKKLLITLQNNSDKDIYIVDFTLSKTKRDVSGFAFYFVGNRKLTAHGSAAVEYVWGNDKVFTPELNCVVFQDNTFEGDKYFAKRVVTKREQRLLVLNQFKEKISSLKGKDDIQSLHQEIGNELAIVKEDENRTEIEPLERACRRAALLDLLTEVNEVEKSSLVRHLNENDIKKLLSYLDY